MGREIEVKILDICVETLEKQVLDMGAVLQGDWLMETIIFDYPDRRLLNQGSYIRIRSEGEEIKCTYKAPVANDENKASKIMLEHDVVISDLNAMKQILIALGLQPLMHFEKKRKHYVLEDIVFDFDTLPGIPSYLEIEVPHTDKLKDILKMLNIPSEKAYSIGPKEVLAHYGLDIDKLSEMKF